MKPPLSLAIAATIISLPATSFAGDSNYEFLDYLQGVENCFQEVDAMPQDGGDQQLQVLEMALSCEEGVGSRSYSVIFRETEQIKEHLFMLEVAVAALREHSIEHSDKLDALEELVSTIVEANQSLYYIGYLN